MLPHRITKILSYVALATWSTLLIHQLYNLPSYQTLTEQQLTSLISHLRGCVATQLIIFIINATTGYMMHILPNLKIIPQLLVAFLYLTPQFRPLYFHGLVLSWSIFSVLVRLPKKNMEIYYNSVILLYPINAIAMILCIYEYRSQNADKMDSTANYGSYFMYLLISWVKVYGFANTLDSRAKYYEALQYTRPNARMQ